VGRQVQPAVRVFVAGPGDLDVLDPRLGNHERRPAGGQDIDAEADAQGHRSHRGALPPDEERQQEAHDAVQQGPPARRRRAASKRADDPREPIGRQDEGEERDQPGDDHEGTRAEQEPAQGHQHARDVGRRRRGGGAHPQGVEDLDRSRDHHDQAQDPYGPAARRQRCDDADQAASQEHCAVGALGERAGALRWRLGACRAPHDPSRSKMLRVMRSTNRSRPFRP
jgi:hypothetical protein